MTMGLFDGTFGNRYPSILFLIQIILDYVTDDFKLDVAMDTLRIQHIQAYPIDPCLLWIKAMLVHII
jgi:hypothetical protein